MVVVVVVVVVVVEVVVAVSLVAVEPCRERRNEQGKLGVPRRRDVGETKNGHRQQAMRQSHLS